jgi:hypothetical protein
MRVSTRMSKTQKPHDIVRSIADRRAYDGSGLTSGLNTTPPESDFLSAIADLVVDKLLARSVPIETITQAPRFRLTAAELKMLATEIANHAARNAGGRPLPTTSGGAIAGTYSQSCRALAGYLSGFDFRFVSE